MHPAFPFLGHGIGLRREHFGHLLDGDAAGVDWFEAISENFFEPGGRPKAVLDKVRAARPVVLHGVSLGIGGVDPLSESYLGALDALAQRVEPAWVSDHLCWAGHGGAYGHDLWPLPLSEEALDHVARRVQAVQERLGRPLMLENVSSYVDFVASTVPEWQFLNELARRTGCGLLLDVNNVYVSARNHGFSAEAYIDAVEPAHVGQIHLAGHDDYGSYLFDSHTGPVPDPVWQLYERALRRLGPVSTLVEWDTDVPAYASVVAEASRAASLAQGLLGDVGASPRTAPGRPPYPLHGP
jgi:uncharacterized protein (UPF0276 family)